MGTKRKAEIGVAKAIAGLVGKGFEVSIPLSEHSHFDLVIWDRVSFRSVQVKHRNLQQGSLKVVLGSSWSDKAGHHFMEMDRAAVDLVCVYCPQTDECYYANPKDFGKRITLRVEPVGDSRKVKWAKDFRKVN